MKGNMKKLSEADNGEQGVICEIQGDTRFLSRVTSIGPVSYTHLDVYKRQSWEFTWGMCP